MHSYTEEEIALYVNGDMTGEDQQQFEQVLQTDKTLRENVQEYREVKASLSARLAPDAQDKALKHTLQSLNEEYFGRTEAKIRPVGVYIKWACAAAAIAIILVINLFHPWRQNDLYKEYSSLQMVTTAERGDRTDTLLQQAATAFNNQEFGIAQKDLHALYQQEPDNALVQFYYAVSLVETGDHHTGQPILEHIYQGSSIFKYDAAYFLALSYLKINNYEACRQWLQKVPAGTGKYAQAQSLMSQLPK
ncbi:Tetratricopeptide repeat-containing protein [Chitinophaga sp. CF118]|uniref:tetratricopeptide repeat protein n=1 Tax=Chitinophaga sp. CF118 TaxID=1884367 RepID=UPI0008F312B0|nr:tetratricopeptide repeat protein [Chitinophaga sp. CF118]SFD57956.1 Tetratricopeptide repeat-containing protein [Chitinophaga sp. CF118]